MLVKTKDKKAIQKFKTIVKNVNPITPILVGYYKYNAYIIEISKGASIFNNRNPIYGVTTMKNDKHLTQLSNVFSSLSKAKKYIKTYLV